MTSLSSPNKTQTVLIPFYSNIILEPVGPRTQTEAGLFLPSVAQVQVNQGKVLDYGPQCSTNVKMGDILFFAPHSEHRIDYRGNKFIVVSEDQVLGAIRVEDKAE